MDGKWTAPRERRWSEPDTGTASSIVRGTALAKACTATAVHLDDYETHDDRQLLPGTGFTIEPGVYFDTFGVRTEINMFRGEHDARVTGTRQMEIMRL